MYYCWNKYYYYNQQSRERDEFAFFIVPLRMAVKCKAD